MIRGLALTLLSIATVIAQNNINGSGCGIASPSRLGCVKPDGSTITVDGQGVLTALVGGTGTVTSIGLIGTANQITVTGTTPITGSGSWTLSIPASPVFVSPLLGTPTSATLTNATGLPLATGVTGTVLSPNLAGKPYDLVADGGADPTGAVAADTAFTNAHTNFNGKSGGTITGCGTFTLTAPQIVTNPGLKYVSNCGVSGSNIGSNQFGGFVIQASTNLAIPNQTAGPLATPSITSGSLAAGTFYIATTLTNGSAAETMLSPSTSAVVASGVAGSIVVSYPQYQSGGIGYYVYCSTDNVNFFRQPAVNFNGNGTLTGPPFVTGVGTSTNPVLNTCTTSGTAPPISNTTAHGMFLFQVGTNATNVAAGPAFEDVTFADSSFNTLGGGIVVVQAQRTKIRHCYFRGFQWNGTAPGGALPYESGAIAVSITSNGSTTTSATNYTSLQDNEFNAPQLSVFNSAPDTDLTGGNVQVKGSTAGVGIDAARASANIRISNLHMAQSGSGATAGIVIRGDASGGFYDNIIQNVKIEGQAQNAGPAIYLRQGAHNNRIDIQCIGDSATAARACVRFDSTSTGNMVDIANELSQCAYSDGTTCLTDPSTGNMIRYGGSTPGMVFGPLKSTTGTRYLCIDTTGLVSSSASACSGT